MHGWMDGPAADGGRSDGHDATGLRPHGPGRIQNVHNTPCLALTLLPYPHTPLPPIPATTISCVTETRPVPVTPL